MIIGAPTAWGLPADYNELTSAGKKLARVWRVQERSTPEQDVLSWNFFRSYHLNHPDSVFYDHWVDPAPGHFEWVWTAAQFPRIIMTAHRGSAKSTIMSKELPLRDLVSVPQSDNFVILNGDLAIQRHTIKIMDEIDRNSRIRDDFGILRPKRTEGSWNHHYLRLNNYASMTMGTVNSMNLRGLRPKVITLDDVERDPKPGTNVEMLIAQTEQFFFQVVLPMARKHCKVRFCGTPNSKQTLIWRLQNDNDPRIEDGGRFHNCQYWFFGKDGKVFWPGEYPTQQDIDVKRKELGPDVWAFEMLGEEPAAEDRALHVDPVKNEYSLDDPGAFDAARPFDCGAIASWADSVPGAGLAPMLTPRMEVAGKFFRDLYRVITVDYASTVKPTSDMSVISVFGVDRLNQVFLLDIWGGRVRQDFLINKIWEMARTWQVRVVGVEAVAMQVEFYAQVAKWKGMMASGHWMPQPVPITYPHGLSKPERISALRWRFVEGAIKFPRWRSTDQHFRELHQQIRGFRPDPLRNLTGLGHDDHIDTVAMVQELIGGRRAATIGREPTQDVFEAIRRGKDELPHLPGMPIGTLKPLHLIPRDCLELLMQRKRNDTGSKFTDWQSGGM